MADTAGPVLQAREEQTTRPQFGYQMKRSKRTARRAEWSKLAGQQLAGGEV